MNKRFNYVLGATFIITSGILYTAERFIAYFSWVGVMNAHTGSYDNYPSLPDFQTNVFIPIFIIIGICFFVSGLKIKERNPNNKS